MQLYDDAAPASHPVPPRSAAFVPGALFGAGAPEAEANAQWLRQALVTMRDYFGMDVAFISQFRDGRCIIRYVAAREGSFVSEGQDFELEGTYCQRIVDGRLPGVIRDAASLREAATLPVTADAPIGACLGAPIRLSDGTVFGTFCCFSARPDARLSERDGETMRLFAEFVAPVLERRLLATQRRLELSAQIGRVLREHAFFMVYQPIVEVASGAVAGYEALARFTGEPLRPPDRWFRDAAQAGMQEQLELAAAATGLQALRALPPEVYVSVNLAPATLLHGGFEPMLEGLPLERVMVEVTEHASIDDYGAIALRLAPLRERGLRVAVDDAGAGFASFRHILKIRPDDIKLDISLIRKIDRDVGARALAAALARFAAETGSRIVAEGVETESVLQVLRELGVDKAQGYLLGRPQALG